EQRQRTINTEKDLAAFMLLLNPMRNYLPGFPGGAVKEPGQTYAARHPPRQDNRFKHVPKTDRNQQHAHDSDQPVQDHCDFTKKRKTGQTILRCSGLSNEMLAVIKRRAVPTPGSRAEAPEPFSSAHLPAEVSAPQVQKACPALFDWASLRHCCRSSRPRPHCRCSRAA